MKVCFICTKPLQIMISMIISVQYPDADLVIVDDFEGALDISYSEELRAYFNNISCDRSRESAIIKMARRDYSRVFIDSDVGLRTHLSLFACKLGRPALKFSVYEEGIGTYRNDLIPGVAKGLLYRILGAARYFGGSVFVSEVHCFEPERYLAELKPSALSVVGIDVGFVDWLWANQGELLRIFSGLERFSISGTGKVFLYLSSWKLSPDLVKHLGLRANVLVKPHPHIKSDKVEEVFAGLSNVTLVPGGVPAEIVILYLLNSCNDIFVLHSGSSVAHYLGAMKSVHFIDVRFHWKDLLNNLEFT